MLFEVRHTNRFQYTGPVVHEPMTVRLRPRADRCQRLLSFRVDIDPRPAGVTEVTDLEGNDTTLVWFAGETTTLDISTSLKAETLRSNPFDYIVLDSAGLSLPMVYPEDDRGTLERYLRFCGDRCVADWAGDISRSVRGDAMLFLGALTSRITDSIVGEVRLEGDARGAAETLETHRGSCRDVAVLFMEACRHMGIASRFVSGYQQGDPDETEKHLHAWPEAYLQGVGWRGYDPTLGIAVADGHLAVAAGPTPRSAAPTQGSYRGAAQETMESEISLTVT
ncbi:MAG: transglutaminase family protein [Actinomycetota bacterium]